MSDRDSTTIIPRIMNDYSIELNLVGEHLDPEAVSRITGMQPSKTARKGEPCSSGREGATFSEGIWAHEVSSQDDITECRDHQLTCLIDAIAPHVQAIREHGVERIYFYYTLSSFIGMMNIKLNADTLTRLGSIGADFYVTCFDCFDPKHSFWNEDQEQKA